MTTKNQLIFLTFLLLFVMVMTWGPLSAGSQNLQGGSNYQNSFSYQGQLKEDGLPVSGSYDFQFKLYDAASAGGQIGDTQQKAAVAVSEGIFTVLLDFGPAVFHGGARWLEVSVRPAGGGAFVPLSPRQLLTPTPYASHAFSIADGAVTADKIADGVIDDLVAIIEDRFGETLGGLQDRVGDLETANTALQAKVDTLETLLAGVSRVNVDGFDTLRFSGLNVQIINGTGSTDGTPNGLGNLIVGYNELRTGSGAENIRTGSHYVIIGRQNNYSAFGGVVAGSRNTASGNYASVSGGVSNTASGNGSLVSGGLNNTASGLCASISGGFDNTASEECASVSGGYENTASGRWSSVSGGHDNTASGDWASVSGGRDNDAGAMFASVSGGRNNTAGVADNEGDYASILGGLNKLVDSNHGVYPSESTGNGDLESRMEHIEDLLAGITRETIGGYDTLRFSGMNVQIVNGTGTTDGTPNGRGNLIVGYNELRTYGGAENIRSGSHYVVIGQQHNYSDFGGLVAGFNNTASGNYASVSGGRGNTASGHFASVSGGNKNTASGNYASVTGGQVNHAQRPYTSVSGGSNNIAGGDAVDTGQYASVSGGRGNTASGHFASVSGGYSNTASFQYASVSGGTENTASGNASSVSGGMENTSSGWSSSVSGGRNNTASDTQASVSGGYENTASGAFSSILGGYAIVVDTPNGIYPPASTGNGDLEERVDALETDVDEIQGTVGDLTSLLAGITRETIGGYDTLRFSGLNVQIVNGTGTTDGTPNGRGNLIVGYNELRTYGGAENIRTGSHYVIMGRENNYSSYGGFIAGLRNTVSGFYASVSGGTENTASGTCSSVSGGAMNTASWDNASVSGGYNNTASGSYASVSGGLNNTASGHISSVSGGWSNLARNHYTSVSGGRENIAGGDTIGSGQYASVAGGSWNTASGDGASVSGGSLNTASGSRASVSGGGGNTASGDRASVSGGAMNTASGSRDSVSGGRENAASGDYSSILGGYQIEINALYGIYPF